MATSDDVIWMTKEGDEPWRVVTRDAWVRLEREAGFRNTMGRHDSPGTGSFSGASESPSRRGTRLRGSRVYLEHFGDDSYVDDPERREAILQAIKDRNLVS